MPGQGTQVLNKIHTLGVREPKGLNVIWETTVANPNPLASWWQTVTGSSQGSSIVPDVLYNQTSAVSLKAASGCPQSCRPYLTKLQWAVNGVTAWTTATSITVQDTSSGVGVVYYIPLVALQGLAKGTSGVFELTAPLTKTMVSYVASTGVLTFGAGSFTTTRFANCLATIVAGTGQGQSFLISANGTATVTAATPLTVVPDNTSVVAFWYNAATAGGATSITDAKASFPDLSGGYSVVIISGTGAGQVRRIASNTSTAITVDQAWTTNPDNTSNFYVTTNPAGMGVIDQTSSLLGPACAVNTGLNIAVNGTAGAGSPVRFLGEGFWAY